ncbi:MAG: hypothetical protein IJT94_11695 [Oscillibacter sp.]|nr:hypothetical protein [Oscillibacter sp.]
MGMTDAQWKDAQRHQLEDWEEVEELFRDGKQEEGFAKIAKIKRRIREGIES